MIKSGLKNYFRSFRLFFLPLGALSLGIVCGLSILIPWVYGAIKGFVVGIGAILGRISFDWGAVKDTLIAAFRDLDWTQPQQMISKVFSEEYLSALLKDCAAAALGDVSSISAEMQGLLTQTIGKITAAFVVGALFAVLGAFVAYFATRISIRRDIAKRSLWKFLLVTLVNSLINVSVLALGTWLIVKVQKIALLSFFLTVLLYGAIVFFEAYIVHGYKKVPLKQAMRVKNFFSLFLLIVIELAIMTAIIGLVFVLTNAMIGAYVGFSVLIITLNCLSMNAEAYVKDLAKANEEKKKESTASEGDAITEGFAPEVQRNEGDVSASAPDGALAEDSREKIHSESSLVEEKLSPTGSGSNPSPREKGE